MDNQAYETALESFSGVLEVLSAGIKKLTKTPLDVPEIAKNDDDSRKREALRLMLKSLASVDNKSALSTDDINRASDFFASLYGGREPYRHRYADVCGIIFSEMDQSNGELDDGVPYSVNCLAENIRIIHEHMVVNGQYAQARSVLKLADHIDLEKTRLGHYINQQQAMREFQEAVAEAKRERIEVDREFTERLEKTRMEYIAVLGVFAAVVLAFNGGVGFVLINTICILLVFIWKMSFSLRKIELGRWPRNCLVATDAILILIMLAAVALSYPPIRQWLGL